MIAPHILEWPVASILPNDREYRFPPVPKCGRQVRLDTLADDLSHGDSPSSSVIPNAPVLGGLELHLHAYHAIMLTFHAIMISLPFCPVHPLVDSDPSRSDNGAPA